MVTGETCKSKTFEKLNHSFCKSWMIQMRKRQLDLSEILHVDLYFSTFFDIRHTSLVLEKFSDTLSYNLLGNRYKDQILATPRAFTAPKGSAAPWLTTTDIDL